MPGCQRYVVWWFDPLRWAARNYFEVFLRPDSLGAVNPQSPRQLPPAIALRWSWSCEPAVKRPTVYLLPALLRATGGPRGNGDASSRRSFIAKRG